MPEQLPHTHTLPQLPGGGQGSGGCSWSGLKGSSQEEEALVRMEPFQPEPCSVPAWVNNKPIACWMLPQASHCAPGAVTHSKQAATDFATHFVMVSGLINLDPH